MYILLLNMEKILISDAKTVNPPEFSTIVNLYSRRIYRVAYFYLKNVEDAADITQETFVNAYKNFSSFCSDKPLFPWLYQITKNLCLNFLKKRNRESDDAADFCLVPSKLLGPEESLDRSLSVKKLHTALSDLPPKEREIILLKDFDGCSYGEISEILSIPAGTVMSRLFYARQKLKQLLEIDGGR